MDRLFSPLTIVASKFKIHVPLLLDEVGKCRTRIDRHSLSARSTLDGGSRPNFILLREYNQCQSARMHERILTLRVSFEHLDEYSAAPDTSGALIIVL